MEATARFDRLPEDPVSNVLKWVLLVVAIASFGILGWTTKLTYEAAPPFPDRFVAADGTLSKRGGGFVLFLGCGEHEKPSIRPL
jgi:hypothetical protein